MEQRALHPEGNTMQALAAELFGLHWWARQNT